ncbi:hypothetical protein E2C01_003693 [Portunus trituberculatus]|uniref:Uncharacterized protein n=1 Tax=Portunus trituberculatus TaxID=210409 RepID=A0A5B7CQF3_PORTR|nr:hypothetical protein [Portunus trituberculatus]
MMPMSNLPGWQRRRHEWPHKGFSFLPQISPHECGGNQGSNFGSATLPQKQRYLRHTTGLSAGPLLLLIMIGDINRDINNSKSDFLYQRHEDEQKSNLQERCPVSTGRSPKHMQLGKTQHSIQ